MSMRFTSAQLISNEYVPIPDTDPVEYKVIQSILISCECDTTADLPNMNYTSTTDAEVTLAMGSQAHIIEDNTIYELKSDGTWKIQDEASRMNVYTKDETQALVDASERLLQGQINTLDLKVTPPIVKLVNESGKNIFGTSTTSSTISGVTFTDNGDGTWNVNGTATARAQKALTFTVPAGTPSGKYILTGCPTGGYQGSIKYCLYIWDATTGTRVIPNSGNDTGEGIEFDWTPDATHSYNITIDIRSGTVTNNFTFSPMICLTDYYNISNQFVPYNPTLPELWQIVKSFHP